MMVMGALAVRSKKTMPPAWQTLLLTNVVVSDCEKAPAAVAAIAAILGCLP